MSKRPKPLDEVKGGEADRIRVPLSLKREDVARLDAIGKAIDLERSSVARFLLLQRMREWERTPAGERA